LAIAPAQNAARLCAAEPPLRLGWVSAQEAASLKPRLEFHALATRAS
jgi:hypothetical protein